MRKIRVAVIMGGRTAEHAISLATGRMVLRQLDIKNYTVIPVIISRAGRWSVPTAAGGRGRFLPVGAALSRLLKSRIDCIFIAMHGPYGEDGTIQGMMEMLDLPYTGSDVCASALAMDKAKAKEVYHAWKIPTPPSLIIEDQDWRQRRAASLSRIRSQIGYPVVLKPVRLGSSVGIFICKNPRALLKKLPSSLAYGGRVLVEKFTQGREITCAVLDTPGGRAPVALPPTEIIPRTRAYFDYHAKYTPGASIEITPARIGPAMTRKVQSLSLKVHAALGCSGMSRTDLIMHGKRLSVLETNTIPGMTRTSLLPQAARAHGLNFPQLLDRIIAVAMETHRKRRLYSRVRERGRTR